MSAMLIATHPLPVRKAIDQFRRELDWRPVTYLEDNNRRLQGYSRAAAGRYLGLSGDQVALTDSTTLGAALVYGGLKLAMATRSSPPTRTITSPTKACDAPPCATARWCAASTCSTASRRCRRPRSSPG
jgi:selenocysteine lyase/cysteine desulfurase